jgi:hypothetical protein
VSKKFSKKIVILKINANVGNKSNKSHHEKHNQYTRSSGKKKIRIKDKVEEMLHSNISKVKQNKQPTCKNYATR